MNDQKVMGFEIFKGYWEDLNENKKSRVREYVVLFGVIELFMWLKQLILTYI